MLKDCIYNTYIIYVIYVRDVLRFTFVIWLVFIGNGQTDVILNCLIYYTYVN